MHMRKIMIGLALTLVLGSAAWAGAPGKPEEMPPPPPMAHMMGLSGICADQQHLYVIVCGKILQYGLPDMALLKTVDLPEPGPPPGPPPKMTDAGKPGHPPGPPQKGEEFGKFPPPPPHMGPQGILASNGSLFVMAGPKIYRYAIPDLTLQATVELPKPEPPKPPQPGK